MFFSAILAGYFAWKTVRSSPETDNISEDITIEKTSMKAARELDLKTVRIPVPFLTSSIYFSFLSCSVPLS